LRNPNRCLLLALLLSPLLAHAGLSAQWRFNEGTGTTAADVTGVHAGALITGATWGAAKFGASALSCPGGGSDYVDIATPVNIANTSFSVLVWIFPTSNAAAQDVAGIHNAGSTQNSVHARINANGSVTLGYFGNDLPTSSTGLITFSAWNHVVWTYNSTTDTSKIYVNAVEQASGAQGPMLNAPTGQRFCVSFLGAASYSGRIDEAMMLSHAASPAEVMAHLLHRPRYR